MEHDRTKLRLLEAIKSSSSTALTTHEKQLEEMAMPHREPAAHFFEYSDISHEQAQAAISNCYRCIAQYEQSALSLAHWLADTGSPCSTFGWAVSGDISTGNNFFLSMTKRLPGVSPEEALQRSWAIMSRARREDKSPSRRLARSAVLQNINASTCVVGDDLHHPIKAGVRMRTITVRFRMTTDRGFAVGLGTVNPQNPALRKHHQPLLDYMDVFSWHDFAHDEDGTGCVVTLKGLTQYDTNENLRLRLLNALCSTCRWENEVTRTPMRFLAI